MFLLVYLTKVTILSKLRSGWFAQMYSLSKCVYNVSLARFPQVCHSNNIHARSSFLTCQYPFHFLRSQTQLQDICLLDTQRKPQAGQILAA